MEQKMRRGAERHPKPTKAAERQWSLTASSEEPYHPDLHYDKHGNGPQKSGHEHPEPGTYGVYQQLHQVGALRRQALARLDWTTGTMEDSTKKP